MGMMEPTLLVSLVDGIEGIFQDICFKKFSWVVGRGNIAQRID